MEFGVAQELDLLYQLRKTNHRQCGRQDEIEPDCFQKVVMKFSTACISTFKFLIRTAPGSPGGHKNITRNQA